MKIALIVIAIVIVAVIAFLYYMGMFSKVEIKEEKKGPFTFAYVEHIGPYSGVGKPMMELDKKMREAGFDSKHGLGIYYGDPKKVEKDKLRSEVGSIITQEDMAKMDENQDKFNFKTLEEKDYLTAEFPIKNIMSYMFGPMKVYPVFNKYFEEKGMEAPSVGIEYYDMEGKKIIFMMER
ncbi:hypothetical protein GF382_01215 [Candidatus Falkowbacteria bacterium]|nr:hypothetical protein [Candidatus Falkowbacteria bacterium]